MTGCLKPGLLIVSFVVAVCQAAAASGYEQPPVLGASAILPTDLVSGPNHRVREAVHNDGFLNRYEIESKYGSFTGITTSKLRKRVHEINVLAGLEAVTRTKIFKDSVLEAGGDAWHGIKNFVTSPVDSLSGAVSGVAKVFGRIGEHLFGSKRSDFEDSRFKALIGFSKTKREYAYQFGVDVYSTNTVLQDRLDELAWAGYAGGLSVAGVMSAIPGGAGVLVSASGGTRLMNEVFRTTAPVDLRQMNQAKLSDIGVNSDLVDIFIDNTVFTPRQQTLLVAALADMEGVQNRAAFVKFAALTKDQDVAHFRQRMAQMYAAYHKNVAPIAEFVSLGRGSPIRGLGIARTTAGVVIFHAPLDYLAWTEKMARVFDALNTSVNAMAGISGKELWLAGSLSPMARQNIEMAGWRIHDNVESRLLPVD